ncbi:hypothetical protein GU926_14525 [Nibribacter ruber]|uniref:Uncharacterized protein n=1 Tax=Nibribacter ruber TaxID=2698458 RepID=A0A6P1P2G5_9BACT|nr:hypothetical protein [Nibribacter ruber]QHL88581.1 hypothetical protein GU926_14525 [Nibribacter ruber]
MVALVYFDATDGAPIAYQNPLVSWVKSRFPEVVTLDLDTASEPMLFQHAQRLLQEARFGLLFLKTGQKQRLGPELKLLDILFQKEAGTCAVAMLGEHPALASILKARPAITFHFSDQEEDLHPFLAFFLENSLKSAL